MKNQALFNYLSEEHGVILLESELDEIVRIVNEMTVTEQDPKLPYDYDFFVPCTEDEIEEVFALLEKAGFRRWDSPKNIWQDCDNGIFVDKEGDCIAHEMNDSEYPIVTIEQLREIYGN